MRILYSAVFFALIPFILLRLLLRSVKAPDYRQRWGERFGFYGKNPRPGGIWFHAVSVGEAEAVFPLIKRFLQDQPDIPILVTTTTPTGSARVKAVLGDAVQHVYLPYDIPLVVKRFFNSFRPVLAVVMETELWPNLYHHCGINQTPLYVINARLSVKSANGYRKLPALIYPMLANIKQIAAQTQEDAERFIAIGATPDQVRAMGNIKYDLDVPASVINAGKTLKNSDFKGRKVWLSASTHHGEEQVLMDAFKVLKQQIPELLLVIAPRHPERFAEVEGLCQTNNLAAVTRTSKQPCHQKINIYLADTMGELKMLYAASDVAFVGGSLVPVGGHNILEALAAGVPVLFGHYMANFKEIAEKALQHKAAVQCADLEEIVSAIQDLYMHKMHRTALINNGKAVLQQNRGVIHKLYEMLISEIN